MSSDDRGWRQFQKLSVDRRAISRRMKRAEGLTTRHAHRFIVSRIDNIRNARRRIMTWLALVALVIMGVGGQMLLFRQNYQTTGPDYGGLYAEASLGPVETLNPLYASSTAEVSASRLMFSSLYSYDRTGHAHGDLAESTQVDQSGSVYTVTMRPGARWHDGVAVTAKDVEFTIGLIKNPAALSPLRINWTDVEARALSDTVVQFKLPAPYASFLNALTFPILPRHILSNVPASTLRESTFSQAPIGSGPFKFNYIQSADRLQKYKAVQLTANAEYYLGKPLLNKFEIHAYADTAGIMAAIKTNEVNGATDLTPGQISQLSGEYRAITPTINNGTYLIINTTMPNMSDVKVRRALQLATDTVAIRNSLATKPPALWLPFIPTQLTATTSLPAAPQYDIAAARKLLDEAGWKLDGTIRKKDGRELAINLVTTKDDTNARIVKQLQDQWSQLGMTVATQVVNTSDPTVHFTQEVLQPRKYDVLLRDLAIGADPDVYAYWHSSQIGTNGYNFSNYTNRLADAALSTARGRLPLQQRDLKYAAFARQWLEDVPAIGLYQDVYLYATNRPQSSADATARWVSATDRYQNITEWAVNTQNIYKTP